MESAGRARFFPDKRLLPLWRRVNLKILFVYLPFPCGAKASEVESLLTGFNPWNIR